MTGRLLCLLMAGNAVSFAAIADELRNPAGQSYDKLEWRTLPQLPDREGFASGFAGVASGRLLFAGGANFPDQRPWEGGRKVWYDHIFMLDSFDGRWKEAGKLSRPLAYGVSVTWKDSVICVGGSDSVQHYRESFRMSLDGDRVVLSDLPSLPVPIANASGAIAGDMLFVVGGQQSPASAVAEKSLYVLNLGATEPHWERLADIPRKGRILSVAAASGTELFVMSGAELTAASDGRVVRSYLNDAWKFSLEQGWSHLPDMPESVTAAPSPGFFSRGSLFVAGGDNGHQVGSPALEHRGFSRGIMRLDLQGNEWHNAGVAPVGRVTAATAEWNGWNIVLSGEQKPGIRSPEVWAFRCVDNSLPCVP